MTHNVPPGNTLRLFKHSASYKAKTHLFAWESELVFRRTS